MKLLLYALGKSLSFIFADREKLSDLKKQKEADREDIEAAIR
jgi:DNA polymerase III delta subunit